MPACFRTWFLYIVRKHTLMPEKVDGIYFLLGGFEPSAILMADNRKENYDLIKERKPELAKLETVDCGKPLKESEADLDDAISCFEYYADLAELAKHVFS
ncbi:hypothetical protein V6N13_146140 [Hibiscus sabdariffa]